MADKSINLVRTIADYENYLREFVLNMFEWRQEFAPAWIFEQYLTETGMMAIFKTPDGLMPVRGGYSGDPTPYGLGYEFIGADLSGKEYKGKVGEDCIVAWNNTTRTPDTRVIHSYAVDLFECDKSQRNLIKGSRILNIIECRDNKDKLSLDKVDKALENGDTNVSVTPAIRNIDVFDVDGSMFDVKHVSDPADVDKLPYMSRQRDDILSRFFAEYGISVSVVNKAAQLTKDESRYMENAVRAIVGNRLKSRRMVLDWVHEQGYALEIASAYEKEDIQVEEPDKEEGGKEDEISV